MLLDNRGIGGSDAPPGPYTVDEMARDTIGVLDEAGIERAHVVGTSLGGMVAQELALPAPERVAKLVLVCTTPGGPQRRADAGRDGQADRRGARSRAARRAAAVRRERARAAERPQEIVERILEHRLATAQSPAAWLAQASAGATFDALDRLPAITAPTLVLHGTADAVVDQRNAELLDERRSRTRA